MNILAQTPSSLGGTIGGEPDTGLGPFASGFTTQGGEGLTYLSSIISTVLGALTIAAGIWFFFQILIGGFDWITSSGDKTKLENARKRLTNAFIGLVIILASWAVLAITSVVAGVDFLLSNPTEIIGKFGLF